MSSSAPSSSASGGHRFPPWHVPVAETADEDCGDSLKEILKPVEPQDEPSDKYTLHEVLQTEVENLAEEITLSEQEGVHQLLHLEALENGIEASAEALVLMREARQKLQKFARTVRRSEGLHQHWHHE